MQEIEIEMIHRRRRSHRPVRVERLQRGDRPEWLDHIYYQMYSAPDRRWQWRAGGYVQSGENRPWDPMNMQWGYKITFADGTRGACQVGWINEALAALGARVSLRGDGT